MTVVAEGTKTKIRSLRLEDAPLFARWWNDGRLMAAVGFRKGLGVTEEKLYEDFKKEIDDENPYRERRRYVVLDRETEAPIGELSYGELDTEVGKCRVGIKICEISAQGRGFGKDALLAFMRYLFDRFGLQKIEIDTLKDNVRAEALYRKVGFLRGEDRTELLAGSGRHLARSRFHGDLEIGVFLSPQHVASGGAELVFYATL